MCINSVNIFYFIIQTQTIMCGKFINFYNNYLKFKQKLFLMS